MEIQKTRSTSQEDQDEMRLMEFVDTVNNCPLCGTPLQLVHEFDYMNGTVQEDAHCPSCQIRTRRKSFTVH